MPEEERYELVDGELAPKEAGSGRHGGAQTRLGRTLGPYDRRPGGPPERPGGWWFITEALVDFGQEQVRRPDIAGWKRERLPRLPADVPITVIPDWICEVLSTNRSNDLVKKKRLYHQRQVPHYWIVDPDAETLTVHRWTADGYTEVLAAERHERVRPEPFDAIELIVGVLFGDDEE